MWRDPKVTEDQARLIRELRGNKTFPGDFRGDGDKSRCLLMVTKSCYDETEVTGD
jgi:hypothetical protein